MVQADQGGPINLAMLAPVGNDGVALDSQCRLILEHLATGSDDRGQELTISTLASCILSLTQLTGIRPTGADHWSDVEIAHIEN